MVAAAADAAIFYPSLPLRHICKMTGAASKVCVCLYVCPVNLVVEHTLRVFGRRSVPARGFRAEIESVRAT